MCNGVCVCGAKSVGQLPLYLERLKQPSSIEACCLCCNVAQNGTRSVQRTALDDFIAISRDAAPKDTQKASLFIFPFSNGVQLAPRPMLKRGAVQDVHCVCVLGCDVVRVAARHPQKVHAREPSAADWKPGRYLRA